MPASGVNFSGAIVKRVKRGGDERPRAGIKRQIAPLLDQRARQRLGKNALGQAERERLALAFVAGLVAGDKRHRHFGPGPGMVGDILDGLAGAVLVRACGSTSAKSGGPNSGCGGIAFRLRGSSLRVKVARASVTP